MLEPRILATGKTGSVVVAERLKAGYRVRAMVHREDGRSARLEAL
jgi:NAD(P)H dehydrogenase (quinone)